MQTRTLSRLFRIGMWWRIGYGTIRTVLGFMLLKLINVPFSEIFYSFLNYEIDEYPANHIVIFIDNFLQAHPFTVTGFVAAYLIFWGVLDVFLSAYLLRHKLWAFPISLTLIALFILYEIYRFTHTHSLVLLWIILIDLFIYWLIRREQLAFIASHPTPSADSEPVQSTITKHLA